VVIRRGSAASGRHVGPGRAHHRRAAAHPDVLPVSIRRRPGAILAGRLLRRQHPRQEESAADYSEVHGQEGPAGRGEHSDACDDTTGKRQYGEIGVRIELNLILLIGIF